MVILFIVTQNGRLCFGMYGGAEECDVLCNLSLVFSFLLSCFLSIKQSVCLVSSGQEGILNHNQCKSFSFQHCSVFPSQGSGWVVYNVVL